MCGLLNMPYNVASGAWPYASLSSLWALTCELVAARTLRVKVQTLIMAPWVELWSACECTSFQLHGCDDRWHSIDLGKATAVEILQIMLEPQLHKYVLSILRKLAGKGLLEIAFACARCSGLYNRHASQFLRVAEKVGKAVADLTEECFLKQGLQLSSTLPAGAVEHYTYRCGRVQTRSDPRAQARTRENKIRNSINLGPGCRRGRSAQRFCPCQDHKQGCLV